MDYFVELRLHIENIDMKLLEKLVKKFNKAKITASFILLKKIA
jgi:hypothetical protein